MSTHCSNSVTCPNGNCVGCRDRQIWCQDPRCAPFCAQCAIPSDHDFNANMVIIIILFCLITILFIVWFVYGPQLFEQHNNPEQANVIMPQKPVLNTR